MPAPSDLFKNVDLTLRDLSLRDIRSQLENCVASGIVPDDAKVRILLSDGRRWCVGKILTFFGVNDEPVIYLFPVPEEIKAVNEAMELMAKASCRRAAVGQKCGTCPDLAICKPMARITEKVREEFGSEKPADLPGQQKFPFAEDV